MDASKKKIFAVIVVVAIVAVGLGFVLTNSFVHKSVDGRYNYDITYADSFISNAGIEIEPGEGRAFAIVEITLMNENFNDGIQTSPVIMVWKLTLDRMTFNVNALNTPLHPDFWDITLEKSAKWKYTVVFEVPIQSVGKLDASLSYSYTSLNDKPTLEYDENLSLDEINQSFFYVPVRT